MPKIYPGASAMSRMEPGASGRARKRPISSSKSKWVEGWKVGLLLVLVLDVDVDSDGDGDGGANTPFGRRMGVPEMRRLDVRPL